MARWTHSGPSDWATRSARLTTQSCWRVWSRQQVPLELCLTSNLRTRCCAELALHPLRRFFDAGALVTLNTDDPADVPDDAGSASIELARNVFGFTNQELRQLAANSFRASWLPEERKRELLKLL